LKSRDVLRTELFSFFAACRVHETDGSFFESFTALSWKRENKRLVAMKEVAGRTEDSPPSELSVGIKPVETRIHKKEVGTTGF
jgi:BAI1-associated protein 3